MFSCYYCIVVCVLFDFFTKILESMRKIKIVVVGNGMVCFKFCEKIKRKFPESVICVFGEERYPAYDRVHLSKYLGGSDADSLLLARNTWYSDKGIRLYLDNRIIGIDRAAKTVSTEQGDTVRYDYLVLATGSSPFVPSIPGIEKKGVFVYRTLDDLDNLRTYAAGVRSATVMGGGLLGLEAAKGLMDLGIVTPDVVEFAPRLMPRQIDSAGSAILTRKLQALGIRIHVGKETTAVLGGERIGGLRFADGDELATEMLVVSAGIRPRDELALAAGLHVGVRGGIVVDERMRTSDPAILAIGECALVDGMIYGLVAPGYDMAGVAVSTITGEDSVFQGADMSSKLKLIGVDVASFGNPFEAEPACRTIVYEDRHRGIYKRINISADGSTLIGGILVGDASAYNRLLQTAKNALKLPDDPETLILGSRGGAADPVDAGMAALPDTAVICSCEGVSKGALVEAVVSGCETMDGLRACTKAGSGCGGCVPLVKDILLDTMKKQGRYVRNVVCEHFPYSRQELYDLIKIHGLRTYDDVLDGFGKGLGCEVCKPLVSSVLASLWNDMVLAHGNDVAQDSNDRFLANIQKGGTYSVVPRIPGGEITPDKLIVIGQVAKKYDLYTKITGGQRIDMFGAHLNDLPLIWEELIVAGFESGHAYGKALRTVKSCVGSTWCRFGLHDSVSFAIEVENRYKGLRAPHKFKSAVSGCARECAEAQSKDFGIIATERGWNLYVCGNGGMKPQHAQLLASDIDSATCIRYIDRFLMFYIQTADPLTRTATWLNKMEGGIEYLRNVVVHDSLGMAAKWERELAGILEAYRCEWKAAVETPEIRRRFAHFVNAPAEKDPTVAFMPLRKQKTAMAWAGTEA